MRKNQGEKRFELTREDREEIVRLYAEFDDSDPRVRIFDYREFEYREYTVIQPMRRNYSLSEERLGAMLGGRTLNTVWDEETIKRLQAKDQLKPSEEKRLRGSWKASTHTTPSWRPCGRTSPMRFTTRPRPSTRCSRRRCRAAM